MNKLIVIFILGCLVFSCKTNTIINNKSNGYLIINKIVTQTKKQFLNRTLTLDSLNDNEYVISIIKELEKYQKINDSYKLDSLKHSLGIIKGDSILNLIFNKEEYEYLISQKENSPWDLNLIDKLDINENNEDIKQVLHIGKPIYTKNNDFALVYFYKSTRLGISIYIKKKRIG
ncbi:hypothetical protein ES692_17755 [Psychroserpens burtonensis]|uniref:Lipoprotein n=1 Tax=Psychroserpens burtonensis TaxID=49278 RepID=A0A5C7AYT8_9FLAO|nr:hypothetical protein [Psychroserpens burtonensis]TXE13980.1 hypothetical protein ES692_17755 [Psychroserpens burtonensis]